VRTLRRRRTFIVDRRFQYNLIARAVVFILFTILVMGVGLFLPMVRGVQQSPQDPSTDYDTVTAFLYMHEHFWPMAAVVMVVALLGVVHVSHRIAGPLVPFKRDLRAVGEGRFPRPLVTRPGDYLKEEVEIFNEMVEGLSTRFDAIKRANSEVICALEDYRSQSTPSPGLDRVATKLQVVEDVLAEFRRDGEESVRVSGLETSAEVAAEEPVPS
jgi:hypothetical protein